jgi:hypothetical protein
VTVHMFASNVVFGSGRALHTMNPGAYLVAKVGDKKQTKRCGDHDGENSCGHNVFAPAAPFIILS